jgi:CheY-like chemotaxis protein
MNLTVLTVDDNDIHRYALAKILTLAGYDVISAQTGKQALALAAERGPNAVLLDINLPDVNGYEVCFRIRNDLRLSDIPIIFHSATSPTSAAKSRAESVGGTAFLTYPIDAVHLVTVLKGSLLRKDRSEPWGLKQ